MKNLNFRLIIIVIAFFVLSFDLSAQYSDKSQCKAGRTVHHYKNYLIEYIKPIEWNRNDSIAQSKRYVEFLYPAEDSLKITTIVSVKPHTEILSNIDFDSFINNEKTKYQLENSQAIFQDLSIELNKSIPKGKSFLIKDQNNNILKATTFIMFENNALEFDYMPADLNTYNKYLKAYTELISSIKISKK